MEKHSSYDSIPEAEGSGLLASSSTPRRRPSKTRFIILLAALSVTLLITLPCIIPTPHEMHLANRYELNMFTAARRIRNAQSLADTSRLSFLSSDMDSWLRKVDHKNGAKHYMEPPDGCEATVVILRHCEKGHIREHCDYLGYERSVYISTLFGDDHERWPAPSYIFAEGPGHRRKRSKMNFREIETVGPLAKKVGVTVDDSYSVNSANDLAKKVLTFLETGQMCGKLTLIVWKHSNIGHLAHHLGCGPSEGCPLDYRGRTFDDAWQIKFTYRTKEHSDQKDLSLDKKPKWEVYGTVQPEGFDALAFSKQAGDYPSGGTTHGARWEKTKVDYPERKSYKGTAGWSETRLGFGDDKHKH